MNKSTLTKEILSDLTKILAENQKEVLKLITPAAKKQTVLMSLKNLILKTKTPLQL